MSSVMKAAGGFGGIVVLVGIIVLIVYLADGIPGAKSPIQQSSTQQTDPKKAGWNTGQDETEFENPTVFEEVVVEPDPVQQPGHICSSTNLTACQRPQFGNLKDKLICPGASCGSDGKCKCGSGCVQDKTGACCLAIAKQTQYNAEGKKIVNSYGQPVVKETCILDMSLFPYYDDSGRTQISTFKPESTNVSRANSNHDLCRNINASKSVPGQPPVYTCPKAKYDYSKGQCDCGDNCKRDPYTGLCCKDVEVVGTGANQVTFCIENFSPSASPENVFQRKYAKAGV